MPTTRQRPQGRATSHETRLPMRQARACLRSPLFLLSLLALAIAGCGISAQPISTPSQVATLPAVSGADWT
ncbi:MAG TPA: hypothetical protein VGP82_07190, partial [Ktedonobacterales bacterium]|nr:hypothetical protein [Ktedonobacterales bacterium]